MTSNPIAPDTMAAPSGASNYPAVVGTAAVGPAVVGVGIADGRRPGGSAPWFKALGHKARVVKARAAAGLVKAGAALGITGSRLTPLIDRYRSLIGPPASRLQAKVSIVTMPGRWVIGLALAALVVGLIFGWAELVAVALVLVCALLAAVGFVLGRPSYQVTVNLASLRVVVGDRAFGDLAMSSTGTKSAAPSLIELPVGDGVASFAVPRLEPGAVHEESFMIPTQRRAVLSMGPVRSVLRDPLGLLCREIGWTKPEEIFVHPRTVRLDNSSTGFIRDLEGLATREIANDDVSFHALREYSPGDDLRYVHWRSTARVGKLMIRQFEETRRSQLVILLSNRASDYATEDEFEAAVSIAASISRSAQADGKEVTVFSTNRQLTGPTPASLLDDYTRLGLDRSGPGLDERQRAVTAASPGASVIALVTGSATPLSELRRASLRIPLLARCFAIRTAAAEQLGRQLAGDFQVLTVPDMADLPRALRAASG